MGFSCGVLHHTACSPTIASCRDSKQIWRKSSSCGRRQSSRSHQESIQKGEDEQFVTLEELQERLKSWLLKWPANELPEDLQQFENVDDVVIHLVNSACELNVGGGLGSLQWFEVRLES